MKHRWNLESFSLDLTGLAEGLDGPEIGDRVAKGDLEIIERADKAIRKRFHSGELGFYDWPVTAPEEDLSRMEDLASRLRRDYEGALIFGIGGSFLGAAGIQQALRAPADEDRFPIHWVTNVDPWAIQQAKHFASKRKCAAVVISKSGGTTETLSGFFHLARHLDRSGIVAITDPAKGELRRLATAESWPSFPVPPNIGGRYSVLTAVGLFPTLLMGLNARELLQGARDIHSRLGSAPAAENPAYRFAWLKWLWDTELGKSIQYLMPYRSNLEKIAGWYVQLWAESLGKKRRSDGAEVGPTPVPALGTSDQHSILQLLKEGPRDKIVGFVDVPTGHGQPTIIGEPPFKVESVRYLFDRSFDEITHKASLAVEKSLRNSGVPTYRIDLPRIDARALGAFFQFMETSCALAGELYDVEAFDQPGVEEAKRLLRESL